MWDTIQKLEYRARAGIADAEEELGRRLNDRVLLPLKGIHGEALYLTGITKLSEKAQELELLYQKLPERRGVQEVLLLDAWSSATIEGARTTVAQVKKSFDHPSTKDDQMVVNTIAGADYAYRQEITPKNIRRLWEKIVKGACENENQAGSVYRSGMVYVGSADRIIHAPAQAHQLPQLMEDWFKFRQSNSPVLLLNSFVAHFYFVYVHPFCDGNGRTARICVSKKSNVVINTFDFVGNAKSIRLCHTDGTPEAAMFRIGAGSVNGIIGYSDEKVGLIPKTAQQKSIYRIKKMQMIKYF